jgi:pimeloyl-ACP methyl ester carboxylesterase
MQHQYFNYKNTTVAYQDQGQGDVIVFLHGFLENMSMWQKTVEDFKFSHRYVFIDLLGHGQTGCLGYIHTMEKQADMVVSLLKFLNINQFSLIGHSMGGYIALAILEKKPKKVNQVVLLNSTSMADSEERKLNRERAIVAVKQNHQLFIGLAVGNLFSENSLKNHTCAIEQLKKEALDSPKQGVIAALSGMKIRKERTFLLEKYKSKFLIILGKKDPVLDFQTQADLANLINVKLEVLTEGHMSWLEDVEGLKCALKSFFNWY